MTSLEDTSARTEQQQTNGCVADDVDDDDSTCGLVTLTPETPMYVAAQNDDDDDGPLTMDHVNSPAAKIAVDNASSVSQSVDAVTTKPASFLPGQDLQTETSTFRSSTSPQQQALELQENNDGSLTTSSVDQHQFHLLVQIQEDGQNEDDNDEAVLDHDSVDDDDVIQTSDLGKPLHPAEPSSPSAATSTATTASSNTMRHSDSPPLSSVGRGRSLSITFDDTATSGIASQTSVPAAPFTKKYIRPYFQPIYVSTKFYYNICQSLAFFPKDHEMVVATWLGFWALLQVTCATYVLTPIRDAVVLQVGVQHMPHLTLASSMLAFLSSVPIGWLFEAPDPKRRKVWKKMGLTRGQTQGTSLALFYRFFALCLVSYAIAFPLMEWLPKKMGWVSSLAASNTQTTSISQMMFDLRDNYQSSSFTNSINQFNATIWNEWVPYIVGQCGQSLYIAFFLVVHLMKLHSLSLVWGVTTEAMEYEEVARAQQQKGGLHHQQQPQPKSKTRLQRLAFVGFGGTVGGILGSILASSMAKVLTLSGLLLVAAMLLEISAQLSIELGRIMQFHWEEQQTLFVSTNDLTTLDPSMRRSTSFGSMKRVASSNSMMQLKRADSSSTSLNGLGGSASGSSSKSLNELGKVNSTESLSNTNNGTIATANNNNNKNLAANSNGSMMSSSASMPEPVVDDNTFTQRLLRGITTILKSRLLMSIFTYNALYASTTTLLSFQRAALVVNRKLASAGSAASSVSADTAFLAQINMTSSVAVFIMQASGMGAWIAQTCGSQGSLALMPLVRLMGVISLAWWHKVSGGRPPNLILFLLLDECTRVINLAVAKPVRESLWRGLSNEARYEAKPIVDTLANRWGGGSAAFLVAVMNKLILWGGLETAAAVGASSVTSDVKIFGFPPVLFLCLIIALWWAMVSFDLGRIRKRIDFELKKRQ